METATKPAGPDTVARTDAGAHRRGMKSVVLKAFGPPTGPPWWWKEVQLDPALCELSVRHVTFRNKRSSKEVGVLELPFFLLSMLPVYLELRRQYDYVYTFECSLASFAISFWQTLLFGRRPRHVILQFIMREKTGRLSSRLKYLMMKWCFSSVHMAICSASAEVDYYRRVFGWPAGKVAFVPYHSSGEVAPADRDEGFVFAAGRTFRDFATFISAVEAGGHKTVIVASRNVAKVPASASNIKLLEDIPLAEFNRVIEGASVVVVPLLDRSISTGQVVILHGMALGKPVIATRTSGSVDYITHGVDGLLVEPGNAAALREAIDRVMGDEALRRRLGDAARQTIKRRHLPHHYTEQIRKVLLQGRSEG